MVGTATSVGADDVAHGRQMYLEYCSSCHGLTEEGDRSRGARVEHAAGQPAWAFEAFRESIAREQVARFIDGRAEVKAHGPRDMPVWGARFYTETDNESAVSGREIA